MPPMTPPVALTIAGSDSGGGAGIQADLKTFAALGVYGTCVVTAVTAQNTSGATVVHALPPEVVEAQLDAVLCDFDVRAVKTGMLANSALAKVVAKRAAAGALPNLVVDPVLVSSSGTPLVDSAGVYELLLPYAVVSTPNRSEYDVLRPQGNVVVTGSGARDVFLPSGRRLVTTRVATPNDHGTGCTFSAAIAAHLALGAGLDDALDAAKAYVTGALLAARDWRVGGGHGPLDHFWRTAGG